MNALFNLKKQAKAIDQLPQQSSQEYLLLRRSLSATYSHESTCDHPPRPEFPDRPSTSHSDTDSRTVSLNDPFNDDQHDESLTVGQPVSLRVNHTDTIIAEGTPCPSKTLFISSRAFRKKVFFTTTPFPTTELEDVISYIETPGYYTRSGISNWSAAVHRGSETGSMLAKVTRTLFWKKMVIEFVNPSEEAEKSGIVRVEVNNVPGLGQRGYTFSLAGQTGGLPKQYRWCGTKMYSKTAGFADLKLVDPDTRQIIATFERKWSFSSFIPPEARADKGKLNDHGRDPIGCLHIFESNIPKEMNQWIIILTGYCVIEAEHRKRQKEGI